MKKNYQFVALITFILQSQNLFATEPYVEKSMNKLMLNIQGIQVNLNELNKQDQIIQSNLVEIKNVTQKMNKQKSDINTDLTNINKELVKLQRQVIEIEKEIQSEKNNISLEDKKIKDLELYILKLKEIRNQRESNIAKHNQNLVQIQSDKKAYADQFQIVKGWEIKTATNLKQLSNEERLWKTKLNQNQIETKKWQKELSKHEKLQSDLQAYLDFSN